MEKTYKVFFNNRILYISEQLLDIPQITASQKYTNRTELQQFINDFRIDTQTQAAQLCGINADILMKEAATCFKYMEAAGGMVRNGLKQALFIYRLGVWDLPKGKMEKGEEPEETAQREVMEECGIDRPTVLAKITDTYHTYEHKGKHILKRTHWYAMAIDGCPELTPQTEEDITLVCWKDSWDDVLANTYPSIADVLAKVNGMGL
ncbi:MAG: NUDIX domain-containing protein [Breznakibacter sp.]